METVLTLAKAHLAEILTKSELLLKYMEATGYRSITIAITHILEELDRVNKKLRRESEKHE